VKPGARRIGTQAGSAPCPSALLTAAPPARRLYRQGFVVGATNPKTLVFFAAVLPQFVDAHAGAVTVQMLVLGLVFVGVAVVLDAVWALAAGAARDWFATSPARLRRVGGTGGLMMIGLGVGLAATGPGD
jgi:threonine/homoserine/homoserine lactone efflux protein